MLIKTLAALPLRLHFVLDTLAKMTFAMCAGIGLYALLFSELGIRNSNEFALYAGVALLAGIAGAYVRTIPQKFVEMRAKTVSSKAAGIDS